MWHGPLAAALAPLGWAFAAGVRLRRLGYRTGWLASRRFPVPVVVVGNITAGGAGKTPLAIWLTRFLVAHGYRPGVACNGYGGTARHWPQAVGAEADPIRVGDEPVLVARRTGCPVGAGPDRVAVVEGLLEQHGCDVIVCDDGLQHLALGRDVEIAVVDGRRRLGNGRCLPAGPLREPASRLARVDIVVANGDPRPGEVGMELRAGRLRPVRDAGVSAAPAALGAGPVHAVAGIADPQRFFATLRARGLAVIAHPFPDHHPFAARDVRFADRLPVIMTEKDAVKCRGFADERHWFLPVRAVPEPALGERVLALLGRIACPDPAGESAAPGAVRTRPAG